MSAIRHASYATWEKVYGDSYEALPARPSAPCPNCAHHTLRLEFVATPADRTGYAAFWCDTCKFGITTSRTHVPAGVPFHLMGTPWSELEKVIPDFVLVQPPDDPDPLDED
ncbi:MULTISPECIES: hypothetical protein [unclassified Saccharothrix]|uniref:hypothetical protein n=1 Tax=unclassified Saccharothrix TaxID=2593673 RepID=UPI00307D3715